MKREVVQRLDEINGTLHSLKDWCSLLAQTLGTTSPVIYEGYPRPKCLLQPAQRLTLGPPLVTNSKVCHVLVPAYFILYDSVQHFGNLCG